MGDKSIPPMDGTMRWMGCKTGSVKRPKTDTSFRVISCDMDRTLNVISQLMIIAAIMMNEYISNAWYNKNPK